MYYAQDLSYENGNLAGSLATLGYSGSFASSDRAALLLLLLGLYYRQRPSDSFAHPI